jgi:TnpA family transposase
MKSERLKILTKSEIIEMYEIPNFSYKEKELYFSLNELEKNELNKFNSTESKIYFILQLGYFKAKKIFFTFSSKKIKEDVRYILKKYLYEFDIQQNIEISKPTKLKQRGIILRLFSYKYCEQKDRNILQKKANHLATISTESTYIFKELVTHLESKRLIILAYSSMQDVVNEAFLNERKRLENMIRKFTSKYIKKDLDDLLYGENDTVEITFIKQTPKNFTWKEITQEVSRMEKIKNLYYFGIELLKKIQISNENIKYYASLIDYYDIYKLKRMNCEITYLYLICFLFDRYQNINDNLMNTFIHYIDKYIEEAKQVAKEKVYKYKNEGSRDVESAIKVMNLFTDKSIPDETIFGEVKNKAFCLLEEDKFPIVSKYLLDCDFDETEYEWEHYLELSSTFKRNLRYIFMNIDFEIQKQDDSHMKAILFLKDVFNKDKVLNQCNRNDFPQEFIPLRFKQYLYETKNIRVNGENKTIKELNADKYEFMVYYLIKNKVASGEISIKESISFKSFEEDITHNEDITEELIKNLGVPYIERSIDDILLALEKELEESILKVDGRIKNGENKHIKIINEGNETKWNLPYEKIKEPNRKSIYDKYKQVGIVDVLGFVNKKSDFISSFTHILNKYTKNDATNHLIIACLVAYGINIGLSNMSEISNVGYSELFDTANNFIRPETLKEANDKISNAISRLPIFKYYDIEKDVIYSSSDGQRFETQFDTIASRYSPKYFGLGKGIVVCSLTANHVPINTKVISANEHESHYVFDILFNNTSDIVPNIHSTDTHGTNRINFALLHIFGYMFAPRYRNMNKRTSTIYGFKNPNEYETTYIKPIRKINTSLIKEEWDNILKIIVSLALKSTTQNIIVKKLSSYERKNKTKRALWEFDNIISSIYMLKYIDSIELRRNVQKSVNRTESFNKLKRAVFHDNLGKFKVKSKIEQDIESECANLLCNSIIYYNAYILSELLDKKEKSKQKKEAEIIKKMSPVAWRHINLRGYYDFYDKSDVDINEIINIIDNEFVL